METLTLSESVARITSEGQIFLRTAARECYPPGTHPTTVARHGDKGLLRQDGTRVKLEMIRSGAKLVTSRQAVLRFFEALSAPATSTKSASPTPRQADRAAAKAHDELAGLLGGGQ